MPDERTAAVPPLSPRSRRKRVLVAMRRRLGGWSPALTFTAAEILAAYDVRAATQRAAFERAVRSLSNEQVRAIVESALADLVAGRVAP